MGATQSASLVGELTAQAGLPTDVFVEASKMMYADKKNKLIGEMQSMASPLAGEVLEQVGGALATPGFEAGLRASESQSVARLDKAHNRLGQASKYVGQHLGTAASLPIQGLDETTQLAKGLFPSSVYDRAQAPVREAEKFAEQLKGGAQNPALMANAQGVMQDVSGISVRLNSMIYDDKWFNSRGQDTTGAHWNNIKASNFKELWTVDRGRLGKMVIMSYEQDGVRYVSFRGSSDASNWLDDFNLAPTTLSDGVQAHRGAVKNWEPKAQEIMDSLEEANFQGPTVFTGHSLGGMMAQLAAHDWIQRGHGGPNTGLLTFGSPPVLDQAGADILNQGTGINLRYQNPKDVVPRAMSSLYVKSGTTIDLESPTQLLQNMSVSTSGTNHEAVSLLSEFVSKDTWAFNSATNMNQLTLQGSINAVGAHLADTYVSNLDYHNAGPWVRLTVIQNAVDTYTVRAIAALNNQAATRSEQAGESIAIKNYVKLMKQNNAVVKATARYLGFPEEAIREQELAFKGYEAYASAQADYQQMRFAAEAPITDETLYEIFLRNLEESGGRMTQGLLDTMVSSAPTLESVGSALSRKAMKNFLREIGTRIGSSTAVMAEIATPVVVVSAVEDVAEVALTSHYVKQAGETVDLAIEQIESSDSFQNMIAHTVEDMQKNGSWALYMQFTGMDPTQQILVDSANPAHVWTEGMDAPGYDEWASELVGDEVTSTVAGAMTEMVNATTDFATSFVATEEGVLIPKEETPTYVAEEAKNDKNLRDEDQMVLEHWLRSEQTQFASLDPEADDNPPDPENADSIIINTHAEHPTGEPPKPGKFVWGKWEIRQRVWQWTCIFQIRGRLSIMIRKMILETLFRMLQIMW